MEIKLFEWYTKLKLNNLPVTPKMIKQKALSITKYSDFIASKGWLEKFKRKFKLELNRESVIDIYKSAPKVSFMSPQSNDNSTSTASIKTPLPCFKINKNNKTKKNNTPSKVINIQNNKCNNKEKQVLNLDDIVSGKDLRTTIMIRNIPIK